MGKSKAKQSRAVTQVIPEDVKDIRLRRYLAPSSPTALRADTPRYTKFLDAIRSGSSLSSACALCGLEYQRVKEWMNGKPSGQRRIFQLELREAIGLASAIAESSVAKDNPEKWLEKGTRNLIEDNVWNGDSVTSSIQDDSGITNGCISLEGDKLKAVIRELEQAGLLTITAQGAALLSDNKSMPVAALPPTSSQVNEYP